jgi:hypothetical protein
MNRKKESFKTTLTLQAEEKKVYDGLTKSISEWWSEMFEGAAEQPGQTFTIRFGSQVFKTMLVEELVSGKKVVWHVVDALIDLPDLANKTEWINTYMIWDISGTANGTVLQLTHVGLNLDMECYHVCVAGWQSFLYSFEKFVTTGVGTPFRLADAS